MQRFASTFSFHTNTYVYMYNINFIYKKSLPHLGKADTHKYGWCYNSSIGISCLGPIWLFLNNKLSHNRTLFLFNYMHWAWRHCIYLKQKKIMTEVK